MLTHYFNIWHQTHQLHEQWSLLVERSRFTRGEADRLLESLGISGRCPTFDKLLCDGAKANDAKDALCPATMLL
jgi:hypothetical protein